MNKVLVCLAGLTALLSQTPAALANPPVWNLPQSAVDGHYSIQTETLAEPASSPTIEVQPDSDIQPDRLKIPSTAAEAPLGVTNGKTINRLPPPPVMAEIPTESASTPIPPAAPASALPSQLDAQSTTPIPTDLGVQFGLTDSTQASPLPQPPNGIQVKPQPSPALQPPTAPALPPLVPPLAIETAPAQASSSPKTDFTLKDLFAGDSDSLVAVTVGNAEGTRAPDGKQNKAFYGHSDPGNGVWNLGTFSYQHGAASPEEADTKQLNRLKKQAQVIQEKATAMGMKLTLEETLNGIDLANQAPQAVIDSQGYVEWLVEAYARGMSGSDAILWARVQSFIDPKTQQWNAPGLGNTAESITRDQNRRMQAIARALDAQNYQISADARLRPQPIGFRLPKWNLASRVIHQLATLFN